MRLKLSNQLKTCCTGLRKNRVTITATQPKQMIDEVLCFQSGTQCIFISLLHCRFQKINFAAGKKYIFCPVPSESPSKVSFFLCFPVFSSYFVHCGFNDQASAGVGDASRGRTGSNWVGLILRFLNSSGFIQRTRNSTLT